MLEEGDGLDGVYIGGLAVLWIFFLLVAMGTMIRSIALGSRSCACIFGLS